MISVKNSIKDPIIILGSSRGDGQTRQAIQAVFQNHPVHLVDLLELKISYYDYQNRNQQDDFIPLAEKMIEHNPIVLATPIYWYTMSAIMKTFIDRWSDLLASRKDLGRRLADKELYIITSYAASFPKGFEDVFLQICDYLKMHYKGCFYFYSGNDFQQKSKNILNAQIFSKKLFI